MNWLTNLSLTVLSALLLGNALAFHQAAREWAQTLSATLAVLPTDPAFPSVVFLPRDIQHALVPPCVFLWFWVGLLGTIGSTVAGAICLGWLIAVVGIIVAGMAAEISAHIWPQPASAMYFGAFYECLGWRLKSRQKKMDLEGAHWIAIVMAVMEQTAKLPDKNRQN